MDNTTTSQTETPRPVRWSAWLGRMVRRAKDKLKAKLRDWCFADYKWVTRAQVQREICAARWEYRDSPLVQRVLSQLQETIR